MRTSIRVVDEVLEEQARHEEEHGAYSSSDTVLYRGEEVARYYRPFSGSVWTDPDDMREAR